MTEISYAATEEAWSTFKPLIRAIADEFDLNSWCDVGGGANPLFSLPEIRAMGKTYTVLDISSLELGKAPQELNKIQADITEAELSLGQSFDLVFSQMLAEHVRDAESFHANIYNHLNSGGFAVHFFPTLYALPFLANRLIPERLGRRILSIVSPRDFYTFDKFPAYYRWCRGPTRDQVEKFESLGYEVVEYRGFFGHSGYYRKLGIVKHVHSFLTDVLLRHPIPYFTSFSVVLLRKPHGA